MTDVFMCGHERTPENTTTKNRCRECQREYQRQWRAGRNTPSPPLTLAERIERRTQPGADGCLIWTGSRDSDGYPKIILSDEGKRGQRQVHRVYWELVNGPIPDGLHLCKTVGCVNRRCINPDHFEALVKGTSGGASNALNHRTRTHFGCGHPRTPENSKPYKDQARAHRVRCRICDNAQAAERCRRWRERHPDKVRAYYTRRASTTLELKAA